MATPITSKVTKLKASGFNLGDKLTNEVDAEYGGFYQRFKNATVYWHAVMGNEAHVLHGGVHQKYIALGGFGVDPKSGKRLLGFPLSDEVKTRDHEFPVSYFEWGAIYWKNGGVALHGKIYKHWKEMNKGSEYSWLGYPLADPIKVAGGEAAFFEFGCLWYGPKTNNEIVEIAWTVPLPGNPWMIKSSEFSSRYMTEFTFDRGIIGKEDAGKLLQELFDGRIFLKETGTDVELQVNINIELLSKEEKSNNIGKYAASFLPINNAKLKNRQLYDICIHLANNELYKLSPHCIYVRDSWTDFKFIHAADLHVSMRLDGWRKILVEKGFEKGARLFNNCNDNFREFIRYANMLHKRDELDFILLTGDLVDYIFEDGGNIHQNNNFVFFRKLILGTAEAPDREKAEELTVPIFTSLGNHDYRTNAYYLLARINLADALADLTPSPIDNILTDVTATLLKPITTVLGWLGGPSSTNRDLPPRNEPLNLTKEEASAIGGNRIVSQKRAAIMVHPDENNKSGNLNYYFRYINRETSYQINLGDHQVLMIDGKWDKNPIDTLSEAVKDYAGYSDEDARHFKDGSPNSIGFFKSELKTFTNCLNKKEGLLIVGVHNPVINPMSGEYPYFLRESIRIKDANIKELVRKYLYRRDQQGYIVNISPPGFFNLNKDIHKDWSQSNTPQFASGEGTDMLDYGIMKDLNPEFLKLCVGVDVARPADLILSGHIHDNLECRIKWDPSKKNLFFYTDFYTENPEVFYNACDIDLHTDKDFSSYLGQQAIKKRSIFKQIITNEAGDNEALTKDESGFLVLRKKEYPDPLKNLTSSQAVKAWWENIRPLFIQTEAIGPMKSLRKQDPDEPPVPYQPIFNGCRHITVIDNLMHRIRYDKKEDITNILGGTVLISTENKWLEPVLHIMMS